MAKAPSVYTPDGRMTHGKIDDLTGLVGTTDGALTTVGATFSQAAIDNNFRELAEKVNAILQILRDRGDLA